MINVIQVGGRRYLRLTFNGCMCHKIDSPLLCLLDLIKYGMLYAEHPSFSSYYIADTPFFAAQFAPRKSSTILYDWYYSTKDTKKLRSFIYLHLMSRQTSLYIV